MKDTNSIVIAGRLVDEAKLKQFDNDFGIIEFTIASNFTQKNKEGKFEDCPSFIAIKYYGKKLGTLAGFLKKGKQVICSGALKQERWEKDGEKKSRFVIDCSTLQLVGGKSESSEPAPSAAPSSNEDFPEDIPY